MMAVNNVLVACKPLHSALPAASLARNLLASIRTVYVCPISSLIECIRHQLITALSLSRMSDILDPKNEAFNPLTAMATGVDIDRDEYFKLQVITYLERWRKGLWS
jgi:hypothetical protein